MASRLDFSQIRSLYIGTSSSTTVDTNNLIVVGSVGIGTTAPGSKLQVEGANPFIRVNNTSADDHGIKISYNGSDAHGLHLLYNANSAVSYIDNTYQAVSGQVYGDIYIRQNVGGTMTPRITIKADGGNVGIGTTSPAEKLQIAGNAAVHPGQKFGWIYNPGTDNNMYNFIQTAADGSGVAASALEISGSRWTNGNVAGVIFTHQTGGQIMTIMTGGNVGIGTTSPSNRLTVYQGGGVRVTGIASGDWIEMSGNLPGYSDNQYPVIKSNGTIHFANNNKYSAFLEGANTYFGILDSTTTTRVFLTTSGNSYLTGGNVGIGTTSPSVRLQVVGANSAEGQLYVGNTDVEYTAGVNFTTSGTIRGFVGWRHTYSTAPFNLTGIHLFNTDNSNIVFGTNNLVRAVIDTNGNVGVGTTSPSDKLDVFGNQFLGDGTNNAQLYIRGVFGVSYAWTIKNLGSGLQIVSTSPSAGNGVNFDFGGNVGIGTTSPSEKLHVDGNVIVTYNNSFQGINSIGNKAILARVSPTTGIINYAEYATATNLNGFVMGSDDARVKGNIATDSLEFITNTSTRMTILSNGDVGINNTNPSRKLDVTGEARVVSTSNLAMFIKTSSGFGAGISYEDSTTGGNDVVYAGAIGAAFFIATGATERVRVLSGGNVGIATNNPLSRLHVVGDARIASGSLGVGVAPNATDGRVDASNDIVAYSTSDQRLKENVTPIENALEKVKTLTGVEFDWKEETAHVHGYHGHDVGIIAQDVQAVLPEAVRTNDSGYLSVRYEKMIALLIEANKELAARVEELEKKLK